VREIKCKAIELLECNVDAAQVSICLDRLLKSKLVTKEGEKRHTNYQITPLGLEEARRCMKSYCRILGVKEVPEI
jgi:DNA-binding PadR family transcriptional regulator